MKPDQNHIIQVVIVDDHPLVLKGFNAVLSEYRNIHIAAIYSTGQDLLAGMKKNPADVLLLDIQLPDIPGDELAPELLKAYPDLKIIVLTNFDSTMYASKMNWIGVHGYLLKTTDEQTLIHAIETVHNGGKVIDAQIEKAIADSPLKSKKILAARATLTTREKEVLQMICNGYTDQKIAEALFLSLNTIRHYRLSLLLKLDVNNTASMVSKAYKLGLVS